MKPNVTPPTWYIAGPMRGIENYNFPLFERAMDFLADDGQVVFSPAQHDLDSGRAVQDIDGNVTLTGEFDLAEFMRHDVPMVVHVDNLLLLDGWEGSEGARIEVVVALATATNLYRFGEADRHTVCLAQAVVDGLADPCGGCNDATRFATPLNLEYAREVVGAVDWAPEDVEVDGDLDDWFGGDVVGLSGYAQAGKDTAAEGLVTLGWKPMAFADPMRAMAEAINPIVNIEPFAVNRRYNDVVARYGYEEAKTRFPEVRKFLQRVGTDALRNVYGDDVWVDLLFKDVNPGDNIVITDVRFPNEAQAIKDLGGKVYRVTRPGNKPVTPHQSETALDDWVFDGELVNDGTKIGLGNALRRTVVGEAPSAERIYTATERFRDVESGTRPDPVPLVKNKALLDLIPTYDGFDGVDGALERERRSRES